MTKQEEVRKKVIEAVPDIVEITSSFRFASSLGWKYSYTDKEGLNQHSKETYTSKADAEKAAATSGLFPSRPIRLADVLLTGEDGFWAKNVLDLIIHWNLRADSLDKQTEECISFLYQLLCK